MYRYEAENGLPMRVKIEINTREQFSVLGFQGLAYELKNPWYSGHVNIKTFQIEELLGTKLKALYQRKKGRDLFDMDYFLSHHPTVDWKQVVHCLQVYSRHEGVRISRAQLEENLILKSLDPTFYGDISPLLTPEFAAEYKPDRAFDHLLTRICPLLKGEGWQHNIGENSSLATFIKSLRRLNSLEKGNPQKRQVSDNLRKLAAEILIDDQLSQKAKDFSLYPTIQKYVA